MNTRRYTESQEQTQTDNQTAVMFPSNCQANFKQTFKMLQKKEKENAN